MGSHVGTPIRWREDVGWEFRCGGCAEEQDARFWPLTDEFWDKKRGMRRCRSCWRAWDRLASRQRHASSSEIRRRKAAYGRRYRAENRSTQHLKDADHWQRVKSDPVLLEAARAKGREAMRRLRARRAA